METVEDVDEEAVRMNHRLEAALHHTVGKICETKSEETDFTYSKSFIACLTKTVVSIGDLFASDLESFSRHAKRTTITVDDVKLLSRRNRALSRKLNEHCFQYNLEKAASKSKQKKRKSDENKEGES